MSPFGDLVFMLIWGAVGSCGWRVGMDGFVL